MNNLERLIQQRQPFKSESVKAEIGLIYIANRITHRMDAIFKPYGITGQQYNVLRILRGQYPKASNINLIKERMLDRMSDASRIVDRLVKIRLATKQTNMVDKRHTDVFISEKGLEILQKIDVVLNHETEFVSKLEAGDIDNLNQLIDKLLEGL